MTFRKYEIPIASYEHRKNKEKKIYVKAVLRLSYIYDCVVSEFNCFILNLELSIGAIQFNGKLCQ
jgi:hypothetical protein